MIGVTYYLYVVVYCGLVILLTALARKYYGTYVSIPELIVVSNGAVSCLLIVILVITTSAGHHLGLNAEPSAIVSLVAGLLYYYLNMAKKLGSRRPEPPSQD